VEAPAEGDAVAGDDGSSGGHGARRVPPRPHTEGNVGGVRPSWRQFSSAHTRRGEASKQNRLVPTQRWAGLSPRR
jgi:hypothetical protein